MKYSKQRELVLQAVRKNKVHPTAEEIYSYLKPILPTISLATVYRNLNQLADAGFILRITAGGKVDRFDSTLQPHYHMCCRHCHGVFDVAAEVDIKVNEEYARENGLTVTGYDVIFEGMCHACATTSKKH